jgi:hypothetical protein
MVFAEALLAGCPIIYPKDAAVDGYFDGQPFARSVRANDPIELANAMLELLAAQGAVKTALGSWQLSADASSFRRTQILDGYAQAVHRVIK